MAKLVDYKDVLECIDLAIKYGWTLEEFKESVKGWKDFIETDEWHSVDEELPTNENATRICENATWICHENGAIHYDLWNGDRGADGMYADGEEFEMSGWWGSSDDRENRITHWKRVTKPIPPAEYRKEYKF